MRHWHADAGVCLFPRFPPESRRITETQKARGPAVRSGDGVGSGVLRRTGAIRSQRVWRVSLKIQFLTQFHGGKTHTTLKKRNKYIRS